MKTQKRKTIKILTSIIFLILLLAGVYVYYSFNNQKSVIVCTNPYEVKDSTNGHDAVKICDNVFYRGDMKVVDDKEFPDLFRFNLDKDSKPDPVRQSVRIFKKDGVDYISIVSLIDYRTWNNSAIGIYRKDEEQYTPIFKRTFDDNRGRWVNIDFGEDYSSRDPYFYIESTGQGFTISGDLGYLGCYGACRILWWDHYDWDDTKKMFVLSNNKYGDNFKKLLDNYEDLNNTICTNEAHVSESISDLYPLRKNKERICSDDAVVPYTTPEQAAMLLKGIKAIKMIIAGENVPMSKVADITLD